MTNAQYTVLVLLIVLFALEIIRQEPVKKFLQENLGAFNTAVNKGGQ